MRWQSSRFVDCLRSYRRSIRTQWLFFFPSIPFFSHNFRGGLHTFESAFAPCLYVYLNLVFVHPHFPFPKCSAPSLLSMLVTHGFFFYVLYRLDALAVETTHFHFTRWLVVHYFALLLLCAEQSGISTINHSVCASGAKYLFNCVSRTDYCELAVC